MKATSLYTLSLIFGLFIPNLAKALTCNSDCRAYASERYVCGYSVTWKSQKPKMCDWVNPLKKAQCETIKELDCAKNKVGDWLQDAFNEDNGLGPRVASGENWMGRWSPGITPGDQCQVKDSIPLISWSWETDNGGYLGYEYGDKKEDYNNLACALDYFKNYTKSHGLWVCEDHKLYKDIKQERHGAYFLQEPPYKVCKLRYRHLANKASNLYERSRLVSACGETHQMRRTFHKDDPLTFNCKDMTQEYENFYKEALAIVDYLNYKQDYEDAFEEAISALDLAAVPEVQDALKQKDESVANLRIASDGLETSKRDLDSARQKLQESRTEKQAVEADQSVLFGTLEAKLELHKQYSSQIETSTNSMNDLLKKLDRDSKRLLLAQRRMREWMDDIASALGQADVSQAQLVSLEDRRQSLILSEYKTGCEKPFRDFVQNTDEAQRLFASMEDHLTAYEQKIKELRVPKRFKEYGLLLDSGLQSLYDQVYRFSFIMNEGLFKLKEQPSLCRIFEQAQMSLDVIRKLKDLDTNSTLLGTIAQNLEFTLSELDKEIAAQNREASLVRSIRKFEGRFWENLASKRMSDAYVLFQSSSLYKSTTQSLIQKDANLSESQKQNVAEELNKSIQKIMQQGEKSFHPTQWKNALWQRLEDVSFRIVNRIGSGGPEIIDEDLMLRISRIIPYDSDNFTFLLPEVTAVEDLRKLEGAVESIEQTIADME